jgi:hypothetical protein
MGIGMRMLMVVAVIAALGRPIFAQDAVPVARTSILTAADRQKLDASVQAFGTPQILGTEVAAHLMLPNDVYRRVAVQEKNGQMHVYVPLDKGELIVTCVDQENAWSYRLDPALNVISSVRMENNVAHPIPDPVVRIALELKYWHDFAVAHLNKDGASHR